MRPPIFMVDFSMNRLRKRGKFATLFVKVCGGEKQNEKDIKRNDD